MRKQKEPKNIKDYLPGRSSAAQLIQCALETLLFKREGIRVHWHLKVSYYYDPGFKPTKEMLVLPMSVSMHSSGAD